MDIASIARTPTYLRLVSSLMAGTLQVSDYINAMEESSSQIVEELLNPDLYPLSAEDETASINFVGIATQALANPDAMSMLNNVINTIPNIPPMVSSMAEFIMNNPVSNLQEIGERVEHFFAQNNQEYTVNHPASEDVISQLPLEATLIVEEFCFCQADREVGELVEVTTLPCNHKFDTLCITTWLRKCNTCPLCRYPLLTGIARIDTEVLNEQGRRMPDPGVD